LKEKIKKDEKSDIRKNLGHPNKPLMWIMRWEKPD
jgi:hypothetical protein